MKLKFSIIVSLISFSLLIVSSTLIIKRIPEKVIIGYPSWGQCDDQIIEAARNGVNVIIWFSINLSVNESGPFISGGPDYNCVANIVQKLNELNLPTINLISIGGWNSPHPNTNHSGSEYYQAFKHWNENVIAKKEFGFYGFDGFDWDLEGNDDLKSDYNFFSVKCLDLMGEMSQIAKSEGYLITMAPCESYLDPTTSLFDRSLLLEYDEYKYLNPPFTYHGRNVFSYLIAKYGKISLQDQTKDVFDLIMVQFYETFSHMLYNTTTKIDSPSEYIENMVRKFYNGWEVDFTSDWSLNYESHKVYVTKNNLVIGLANAWADGNRTLFVEPKELEKTYLKLKEEGLEPKGFGFWTIKEEGKIFEGTGEALFMAKDLNKFLEIRKQ